MKDEAMTTPTDWLAVLQALCDLLSRDPLTVKEVEQGLEALSVSGAVAPEPGKDVPAFVRLVLPPEAHLTLQAIEQGFGLARKLPPMQRGKLEYLIRVDNPQAPFLSTLLIEKSYEGDQVSAVSVRRDMRLV